MKIEFDEYMIRNWRLEDAPSIAKYADNRKIWINLRDVFPSPYTARDAESFLAHVMALEPQTIFAIANREEAIVWRATFCRGDSAKLFRVESVVADTIGRVV